MDFRDDLYFLALTIAQEAGGEPFEGKLGVGFVIVNRGGSIIDTVFRSYQFSCWNSDSPTRLSIDAFSDVTLKESLKAACAAYFKLVDDPTQGATHYLNEEITRKLRGGSLPSWFDESKVTVRIGRHTFLRLK